MEISITRYSVKPQNLLNKTSTNVNITRPHFIRLICAAYQLSMNLLCLKKVKAVSTHLRSSNCVPGPGQSTSGTKTRKRPCAIRKRRNGQVWGVGVSGETSQRRQSLSVWWSILVNINRWTESGPHTRQRE